MASQRTNGAAAGGGGWTGFLLINQGVVSARMNRAMMATQRKSRTVARESETAVRTEARPKVQRPGFGRLRQGRSISRAVPRAFNSTTTQSKGGNQGETS